MKVAGGGAILGALGGSSLAGSVSAASSAHFGLDDGFADTSWLEEEDVQVLTVTEPTREALEEVFHASGPRVVVFETSGTIDLGDTIRITEDKCWVAGQTAPSPGITLISGMLQIDANDCVVQHIRSRIGPGADGNIQGNDAINTQDDTSNNVIDHVTASWGTDECLSVGYDTQDTTVTNCLIYEGLYDPYGDGSDHNYGSLIGDGAENVTLAGNVWAKTRGRVPRLKSGTRSVVANNVMYFFNEATNMDGDTEASIVGNLYIPQDVEDTPIEDGNAYLEDNITDPSSTPLTGGTDELSSRPLWPNSLDAMASSQVEAHNLANAGARPADRTANDERIIQEISDRAGDDHLDSPYDYWIPRPDAVGGYPQLPENTHSLNPPSSDLRAWLTEWAAEVETGDGSVDPGDGNDDDTTAPSTPSNVWSTGQTETSVDLSWDAASDSGGSGLSHYAVSVGDSQQQVSAGTTSATVSGLDSDTSYEASVRAVDGAGNESGTATTTVTTAEGGSDPTDGGSPGSHFAPEDGFADTDWFDDSVEVIKVGANFDEIEAAFTKDSKRLIVFEESGVVDLQGADLSITYGDCWVAGQTAPSPGITFINGMVQVEQDNTVVQHIRILRGDRSGGEGTDPLNSRDGANNVIFDHCTSFWGRDENLSVGYDSNNTTLSNCLVAEGLEDPEENSNGTLVGDGADNVAILGTIYAKNNDRNPRLKSDTRTVVVNGLNFYHDKAIWIDGGAEASVVGNAYIHRFSFRDPLVFGDGSVHMEDNYVADPPLNGRPFADVGTELDSPPLWPSGLEALPAGDVESHNKTFAGARPADRIYQEQKVVDQITERWGTLDVDPNEDNAGFSDIPDSAEEAGGYPDHGGTTHTLEIPDAGLRDWLDYWSQQVVTGGDGGGPPENTDPVVTTDAAETETESATLSGTLDDLGEASSVTVSFEYRESDADSDSWLSTGTQTLSSTGTFSETIDGLSSSTEYEFRAVADFDDGTVTGYAVTFTTAFDGGGGEGGSHFDYADGFATPTWIDTENVDVYRITEPTRSALEEAFHASGPRVVVFETSGTIDLGDTLQITEEKCWVAGQTAPSPGITLIGGMLQVDANDCVVQHIRSRIGPGADGNIQGNDSMNTQDETRNNVYDHCTASWGTDECLSVGYDTQDTTVTNCLIYEGLYDPYGDGSDHNYGTLVGDGASNVTLAGNVWAKVRGRVPRLKNDTETVVVNNFAYFYDYAADTDGSAVTSFVGNVYTGVLDTGDAPLEGGSAYHEDNVTADPPLDDDQPFAETDSLSSRPLWPDSLEAMPSEEVEAHNLQYAGARPADRTENDQRIVGEISARAGNDRLDSPYDYWLAHPDDVGGYPDLPVNTHSLEVPDSGLRTWLEQWALAVEESDESPPGEGNGEGEEPPAIGDSTPRDINGDGLYRDVDGDGTVGTNDVVTLFENIDNPAVTENAEYYDIDGNGEVTISDVVALFEEL
ncbi:fibronectin type III domain-containing protein [Halomontanus rarus]|uniref:fibronectin type III domain-containing protein n=1 Tax=Halomontanus rarus TaxID=3034020 RepID=UPI0023E8BD76|nr:fibronectin type III domain-containing protein [Halovivax sp. TS33]